MSPLLDHSILFILLFPLNSKMTVSLEFKENTQDRPLGGQEWRREEATLFEMNWDGRQAATWQGERPERESEKAQNIRGVWLASKRQRQKKENVPHGGLSELGLKYSFKNSLLAPPTIETMPCLNSRGKCWPDTCGPTYSEG